MTIDPTHSPRATRQGSRPAAGAVDVPARARRRDRWEHCSAPCSKQGVLRWTCWLLLQRTHPWPHQDGAGSGIVEGGPHRSAPAIVATVITGAARAVILTFPFPLPLDLTLVFATVVGVGAGGGGER
jgi:hypothetical protein